MRITAIAFTENGTGKLDILKNSLGAQCYTVQKYARGGIIGFDNLSALVRKTFYDSDALIFVGACGIAVRAIAAHIKSKMTDPAVLVIDEKCKYVVPILSGHIGGANDLSIKVAELTGAVPVITTATDINGKFAVDVFAAKNNLYIGDMEIAKLISAEILQEHKIGLYSDFGLKNTPDIFSENAELGICISYDGEKKPFAKTLNLIPKNVVLGVGCRRDAADIAAFVQDFLAEQKISREAVCAVASIDLKKKERAIINLAKDLDVPFLTYTADELAGLDGDFTSSEFVKNTVGVDNVCERSVAASGAEVTVKKTAKDGATLALGTIKREIDFNEGH